MYFIFSHPVSYRLLLCHVMLCYVTISHNISSHLISSYIISILVIDRIVYSVAFAFLCLPCFLLLIRSSSSYLISSRLLFCSAMWLCHRIHFEVTPSFLLSSCRTYYHVKHHVLYDPILSHLISSRLVTILHHLLLPTLRIVAILQIKLHNPL